MGKIRSILPVLMAVLLLAAGCGAAGGSGSTSGTAGDSAAAEAAAAGESTAAEAGAPVAADSEEPGLLRVGLTDPVPTMDVHRTTSDYMIPLNIYERLFEIRVLEDGSTELACSLAENYSVSEDGRTYSFTLRDDARFSDGTPVKASDVAFTFTRMLALPDSLQTDFADMILGADAVMAGKSEAPEGIRVQDDRHLQITLSEPYSGYLYQLATPSCSILSEKCVTEAGDAFGTDPQHTVGSGHYMVTEFTKERITLERNPYHRDQSLSVQKAQILILPPALMDQTFQNGGLDILDADNIHPDVLKSTYRKDPWEDRLLVKQRVDISYLMLNVDIKPLNDVRIRKAIQMAIDRQKIVDELYDGEGSLNDGIFPRGLIGFNEENNGWLKYDPEAAAALVAEVGDAASVRVELAANSQNSTRDLETLEMIRKDLCAVGLNASIVNYDGDTRMYLRKAGKLMAYTGSWSADFNDPDNFIYTFFGSKEKTAYRSGNYADGEVLGRIAAARTNLDEKQRMAEYAELERILVQEEAVWVPLFSTEHLYVLGERVESFTPFWAGWSSMYFQDVVLKQE